MKSCTSLMGRWGGLLKFWYVSNLSKYVTYSNTACLRWKMLEYRVEPASAFDFEKNLSQPSRSSSPKTSMYVARNRDWQSQLCACPWNAPTRQQWFFSQALGPR